MNKTAILFIACRVSYKMVNKSQVPNNRHNSTIWMFVHSFVVCFFFLFLFLFWNMSFFTFRNTWTCLEYHKRAWCVAVHIFSPFSRFLNCSVLFLHLYHVKLFPSVNCSLQNENILTQFIYLQHEKLAAWWCVAWYGEN